MASERTNAAPTAVPAGAAWHTLSAEDVADRLESDLKVGLSQAEASRRLAVVGRNALTPARRRS